MYSKKFLDPNLYEEIKIVGKKSNNEDGYIWVPYVPIMDSNIGDFELYLKKKKLETRKKKLKTIM